MGKNSCGKQRSATLSIVLNMGAALLVVILLQLFVVKIYQVPSESMEPTLNVGDRIVANKVGQHFNPGANGDIIVFSQTETSSHAPSGADPSFFKKSVKAFGDISGFGPSNTTYVVKRIVGLPGETIECCSSEGSLVRDGGTVDEPYVFGDFPFIPGQFACDSVALSPRCFNPITVPADHYLVMGDHRSRSDDGVSGCRMNSAVDSNGCAWFVPINSVIGKVEAIVWPLRNARFF